MKRNIGNVTWICICLFVALSFLDFAYDFTLEHAPSLSENIVLAFYTVILLGTILGADHVFDMAFPEKETFHYYCAYSCNLNNGQLAHTWCVLDWDKEIKNAADVENVMQHIFTQHNLDADPKRVRIDSITRL